jgi:hypothetical protein
LLDLVLSPALWLSLTLSVLMSLAFTAWRGGDARQLVRDLLASALGFGAGQLLGALLGFNWLRVGPVYVLWGLLGAGAALMLGRALWRWRMQPRRSRPAPRR